MGFEGFCYSVWVAAVCREPVDLKEERGRRKGRNSEMKEEEGNIRSKGRNERRGREPRKKREGNRPNMDLPCVCDFEGSAPLCAVMIQLSLLLKSHWSVFQPLRVPCLGLTCRERT